MRSPDLRSTLCRGCACLVPMAGFTGGAGAQVTVSGMPGPLAGPDIRIPESHGARVGGNLFHSFESFSLAAGQSATFQGSGGIRNIISRVSGSSPSVIHGTIRSDVPDANVFLMNPNGVIFGEGASIDIGGSFAATTADYLTLGAGEGKFFASSADGNTVLVAADPTAFGFLKSAPAPIQVNGSSLETPGGRLVLAGGDIELRSANLFGRVQLASVGGVAEIPVVPSTAPDGARQLPLGRIRIAAGSLVGDGPLEADAIDTPAEVHLLGRSVSLESSSIGSTSANSAPAGVVSLRVSETLELSAGSQIRGNAYAGGDGAGVTVVAGKIVIDDSGISTLSESGGRAGDIRLTASGDVEVLRGGRVESTSASSGAGGSIALDAGDTLALSDGGYVRTLVRESGGSRGGDIGVDAGHLSIDGTGSLSLTGIRTQTDASDPAAAAGDIRISVRHDARIANRGAIDSLTFGSADSGDITIAAGGKLLLEQSAGIAAELIATGIYTRPQAGSTGAGGDIRVTAGELTILRGARIDASALAAGDAGEVRVSAGRIVVRGEGIGTDTGIFSYTNEGLSGATGNAGRILVEAADAIDLSAGGSIDSSTFGTGTGGSVEVRAPVIRIDRAGDDHFTGIGTDSTLVTGGGDAGSVSVFAGDLTIRNGGLVSSGTLGSGNAGTILVTADGRLLVEGRGSDSPSVISPFSGIIASTGTGSTGTGGEITVIAPLLTVADGGTILSSSEGAAAGGSILIRGGDLVVRSGGTLSVRAANAAAGTLEARIRGDIVLNRGVVTANSGADGGDIDLQAGRLLRATASRVTAEAASNGGNLSFRARHIVLDGGQVSANAVDDSGGRIEASSQTFFADGVVPTADSENGTDGTVVIDTRFSFQARESAEEPEFADPDDALQPDCTKRAAATASSFVKAGRGGTTRLPGGYLPSMRILE